MPAGDLIAASVLQSCMLRYGSPRNVKIEKKMFGELANYRLSRLKVQR